jgi:hypothetical protein
MQINILAVQSKECFKCVRTFNDCEEYLQLLQEKRLEVVCRKFRQSC